VVLTKCFSGQRDARIWLATSSKHGGLLFSLVGCFGAGRHESRGEASRGAEWPGCGRLL
jgi:hypothetical protein